MSLSKCGLWIALAALWFLMACGSSRMNVATHQAPNKDLRQLKTFGIARINSDDPEEEKQLLDLVRKNLESRGLRFVNGKADFLVAVHFYVGTYEKYVPPTTLRFRDFNESPGELADRTGTEPTSPFREPGVNKSSRTVAGYMDTGFYQNIQVYFVEMLDKQTVDVIWQGEADSMNKINKLSRVAPAMVDELLGEFPRKTDKPATRKVHFQ